MVTIERSPYLLWLCVVKGSEEEGCWGRWRRRRR